MGHVMLKDYVVYTLDGVGRVAIVVAILVAVLVAVLVVVGGRGAFAHTPRTVFVAGIVLGYPADLIVGFFERVQKVGLYISWVDIDTGTLGLIGVLLAVVLAAIRRSGRLNFITGLLVGAVAAYLSTSFNFFFRENLVFDVIAVVGAALVAVLVAVLHMTRRGGFITALVVGVVVGVCALVAADPLADGVYALVFDRFGENVADAVYCFLFSFIAVTIIRHIACWVGANPGRDSDVVTGFVVGVGAAFVTAVCFVPYSGVMYLTFMFGSALGVVLTVAEKVVPRAHALEVTIAAVLAVLVAVVLGSDELGVWITNFVYFLGFGACALASTSSGVLLGAGLARRTIPREVVAGTLMSVAVELLPKCQRTVRCQEWGGELDQLRHSGRNGSIRLSLGYVEASLRIRAGSRQSVATSTVE